MESTDSFRTTAFSLPAKSTPPVYSEKEYEQGGLFQRVVFPVEASLNRLLWNRSISPNSLLETSISEEVRPRDLEEEEATQTLGPLLPPTTTSRRHTLAEVSARFHQCNPPCIVVSPSDGASSDSCLKSSSSPAPPQAAMGEMSTLLASGAEGRALLPTGVPLALSSHLLPQAQGSLPAASFQEGRRASDTSLTQGLKAFRQQLRKNTRTKGLLGLNKIKGLTRQVVPPASCNRGSRGSLGPALSEHRIMLEEVLHQQRMLQIQHQPQLQVQVAQKGPTQNPLLFLAQQQSPSPPPTTVFASASIFDTPTPSALPPQQASVALQHGPWQQTLETASSGCSSSSSSCYSSSLSPVASAAYLLEARLHISQQTHPHPHTSFQQHPQSTTQSTFTITSKPAMWNMGSASSTDPDMQELGLAAQQLSSCVMVK